MAAAQHRDALALYMESVGEVDLLTSEEETDLAKRDLAGRVAREVLELGGHPAAQRVRLRRLIADGERAHALMIESNLRLVISLAAKYRGRGLDLLDLIQDGNVGLMKAVERFDHTKGFRFSTYAAWWIRQSISRGLADRSRSVRLPVNVHDLLGRLKWKELELFQRFGREPTDAELCEAVDVTEARLREIRTAARDLVSLDTPIGTDGHDTLGQLVPDNQAVDPEQAATESAVRGILAEALGVLSEREREVVILRFGLGPEEPLTLEEIGKRLGVTRERIRQIELRSIRKLRNAEGQAVMGLLEGARVPA